MSSVQCAVSTFLSGSQHDISITYVNMYLLIMKMYSIFYFSLNRRNTVFYRQPLIPALSCHVIGSQSPALYTSLLFIIIIIIYYFLLFVL